MKDKKRNLKIRNEKKTMKIQEADEKKRKRHVNKPRVEEEEKKLFCIKCLSVSNLRVVKRINFRLY